MTSRSKPKAVAGGKKPSPKTRGRGRPPTYRSEFAVQARKLSELGAVDVDIAEFFSVDISTVYRWKLKHPDFCDGLARGKEETDRVVEERLFRRATGYTQKAVKIFMPAGAAEPVYAPYTEHHPPDTQAAMFWLRNRQPEKWRDPSYNPGPAGETNDAKDLAREIRAALAEAESVTNAPDTAVDDAPAAPGAEGVLDQPPPIQHGAGGPTERQD